MIEEDWGALEGSEWGSAPLAEAVTVKPVVKKDTPPKTKVLRNKRKKLKVLDPGNSNEKPVEKSVQPKKKKSKNKYKTDDGRVLGKLEFEELKQKSKAAKSENLTDKKTEQNQTVDEIGKERISGNVKKTQKRKKQNHQEDIPEKLKKVVTEEDTEEKNEVEPMETVSKELTERDIALLEQKEARNSLREKLQNQLKAAEFRFLNEKLYRADKSDDILDDASAKIYHEGFSRQVQRWPVNPVTVLIKHVRKRVPRKHVIADLGCGDAKIAAAVQNTVHSFDLIKHNERVVPCDIRKVPLEDSTVDVAIFCLSLMATDASQFILEANRILRLGGKLLIAEVSSRIENTKKFVKTLGSYGFTLERDDTSNSHFVLFFLKKFRDSNDIKNRPPLTFRPCQYKKR